MNNLNEQIKNIVSVIRERTYAPNHMVKIDWIYPDLGSPNRFLAVDLSVKKKPKPIILELELDEHFDVLSVKQEFLTKEITVEYPWLAHYLPSKEDWLSAGIITVAKMGFLGKTSSLEWSGFTPIKHGDTELYMIKYALEVTQARIRESYKANKNVKPEWAYPEIPEGFNAASIFIGDGMNSPCFTLLNTGCVPKFKQNQSNSIEAKGLIEWPWIDGYLPSPKDWEGIGFSWGRAWDGTEPQAKPQQDGWL